MAGYHLYEIPKGKLGEYSKVIEEFMEFSDAIEQDCSVMAILELSDLLGSLKYYFYEHDQKCTWEHMIGKVLSRRDTILPIDYADLLENFQQTLNTQNPFHWSKIECFVTELDQYIRAYNLTLRDLIRMSHITERAFLSGQRQSS